MDKVVEIVRALKNAIRVVDVYALRVMFSKSDGHVKQPWYYNMVVIQIYSLVFFPSGLLVLSWAAFSRGGSGFDGSPFSLISNIIL